MTPSDPRHSPPRSSRSTVLVGRNSECRRLAQLLDGVRDAHGGVLVLVGGPGVGKTVLLDHMRERTSDMLIRNVHGVRAERQLAYAALHRLLGDFVGLADGLADPQRTALRVAFGVEAGEPPDPLYVGLGTLALLQLLARERPVLCVVDDQQWLDRASMDILAFAGRRLDRDRVGVVLASTMVATEFESLPVLHLSGLSTHHGGRLLDSELAGPLDPAVRRQIVTEAGGNPSTLLELPRTVSPLNLAGGFALPGALPVSPRLEAAYRSLLVRMPARSRRLVELAAADPIGSPLRLWEAAALLGLDRDCLGPEAEEVLVVVDTRVPFVHPVARSAVYRAADPAHRRAAHAALAAVTDAGTDPDRRAWHRAEAAYGLDEELARELDRSTGPALRRGGLAAVAAFRTRAALLTPDRTDRLSRMIAAAEATHDAGALDCALDLLEMADELAIGKPETSRVSAARRKIAAARRHPAETAGYLVAVAPQTAEGEPAHAAESAGEATLPTATWSTRVLPPDVGAENGVAASAVLVDRAAREPDDPAAAQALDGLRTMAADGFQAAAPMLRSTLESLLASQEPTRLTLASLWPAVSLPVTLWDERAWRRGIHQIVDRAQREGALAVLPTALEALSAQLIWAGDLDAAAAATAEAERLTAVSGRPAAPYARMLLAAWQGDENGVLPPAAEIQAAHSENSTPASLADCAQAVLFNATGRFGQAHAAARRAFDAGRVPASTLIVSELADAAAGSGAVDDLKRLNAWMQERVDAGPAWWVIGIAERVRALLTEDDEAAEVHYRASIDHLAKTGSRTEQARTELAFGEWLRRRGRRGDARHVLRGADQHFREIGAQAFVERTARGLRAVGDASVAESTGEHGRLTAQERQIAMLAAEGLTNPAIGARLHISSRTVQYHLRKVFQKLGISSRSQLFPRSETDEDGRTGDVLGAVGLMAEAGRFSSHVRAEDADRADRRGRADWRTSAPV